MQPNDPNDLPTIGASPQDGGGAPAPAPGGNPQGGTSRYRVLRLHAQGGLGEVFVAHDEELKREVALKQIKHQFLGHAESTARFLLEAEVTSQLEHPGIVPVHGLGHYPDGRPYYAMRFIRGESLKEALDRFHAADREGTQSRVQAVVEMRKLLARFIAVCECLAYAHSRGVIHRDLKPANIMLGPYGETLVVDWGLAKALGSETPIPHSERVVQHPEDSISTSMGEVLGTPAYMSPEQATGAQAGPASDIYSLGATLYHLVTGQVPFQAAKVDEVLENVRRGRFQPPRAVRSRVSKPVEAICLKAMSRFPEDRYASARELADDLEHYLAEEPVKAYTESLTEWLTRWRRRNPGLARAFTALVVITVIGMALSNALLTREQARTRQAEVDRVHAQVDALLDADPRAIPALLRELEPFREQVARRLRALVERSTLDERQRARAQLALLRHDPSQLDMVSMRMVDPRVSPEEMLLLRSELAPFAAKLSSELWKLASLPDQKQAVHFRCYVALALFDPKNPRWPAVAGEVAPPLVNADPLHLGNWSWALRPVREALLEPLTRLFRDPRNTDGRPAAVILRDYAADRPQLIAELLTVADPQQFALVMPRNAAIKSAVMETLRAELKKPSRGTEGERDALARRQANAAVALLRLGEPAELWPLLVHSRDPRRRTEVVHRLGSLGTDGRLVAQRLPAETEPSARRALVLALGNFDAEHLPASVRAQLVKILLDWYTNDPDPGLHSAIYWLLRDHFEGVEPRRLDWAQSAALARIDAAAAGKSPAGRRWYRNLAGDTFAIVPGPEEFMMGSPTDARPRRADEREHLVRIGRSFAVATTTVTVVQIHRFLKAHPEVRHLHPHEDSPDPDGPAMSLNWYEAAAYCRWLSEAEGIPENQMCYPPVSVLEACKDGNKPLPLPADALSRTGYRLPTEAEWEYACRAGATTVRFYGNSEELLGNYAWYAPNSRDRAWSVARRMPNDLGLFDVHGNIWQWCHDEYAPYPDSAKGATPDESPKAVVDGGGTRPLRGGTFFLRGTSLRSAYRLYDRPTYAYLTFGLRVARTVK